jgi:hypothetical protein
LEDRCCPTVNAFFDGSNLTLSGSPVGGTIAIDQVGPNTVFFQDGATLSVPFNLTGNLTLNFQGGSDVVVLNLFGNTLPGNLRASLGNGNNSLVVTGNGAGGGIAGMLIYTGGTGVDNVIIGTGAGDAVSVGGITSLTTGGGADFLAVMSGAQLQSDLFAIGLNQLALFGAVAGQVVINDVQEALPGVYGFAPGSSVAGQVVIQGGSGGNIVTAAGLIGGDAAFILGNGNNVLSTSGLFQGNLTYIGGFGSDAILLTPNSVVQGNLIAVLGNGNNLLATDAMTAVQGAVSVNGGNGADNLVLAGQIGGNLSANLGNGTNQLLEMGSVGGTSLSYAGGSGVDTVVFMGTAPSARLLVLLGAGDDQLLLLSTLYAGGFFDGGTGTNGIAATSPIVQPSTVTNFG